jgi:hypothetical protein
MHSRFDRSFAMAAFRIAGYEDLVVRLSTRVLSTNCFPSTLPGRPTLEVSMVERAAVIPEAQLSTI